jgi:hypothetical protein
MTWIQLLNNTIREKDIVRILELPNGIHYKYVVYMRYGEPITVVEHHDGYDAIRYIVLNAHRHTRDYAHEYRDITTAE